MVRNPMAFAVAILAAILAFAGLWTVASAQSQSYKFEPIKQEILVGEGIRIEVRLIDPGGKPVSVELVKLTATRLDMGPDGMAMMDTPLTPAETDVPGVFAFEADIVMAGRWALAIEAQVEGQLETVKGAVIYTAVEKQASAAREGKEGERKILYYRNPMGLPDISETPKKDSMGMDYIPVYEDEVGGPAGTVRISLEKVQRAGVRTVAVKRQALSRDVRGAGMVMADEARLAMVTAKFSGFVQKLDVRTSGETVEKGQKLLTAWVENGDLIKQIVDLAAFADDPRMVEQAKDNLRLFDVPERDIAAIAQGRASKRTITFEAPLSGTVLDKPAVDGMRFQAGDMLYRIADLSEVWVIVQIPEQDLAVVREGQSAALTLPSMPGEMTTGTVDFIYPELDMDTRSGRVRLRVPNPDGRLKLGLFAHAIISAPLDEEPVLAVPASAVIHDGVRARVFVARGEGLFEPREIETGAQTGEYILVKDGISEGEDVVANGTFLIDAESNLQAALQAFSAREDEL